MPVYSSSRPPPYPPTYRPPGEGGPFGALKKLFAPIAMFFVIILKFFAKLKFLVIPLIKFLPVMLKTGGTMVISVWAYAMFWGWRFALGFVLLLLVHECGHLIAARWNGLLVGLPVFIPFMGAIIALREAPRNAWIEAQVGIGGPLLGTLGAVACIPLFLLTRNPIFLALANTGFFLNLFNLMPFGPLDGGRVVTAISPWLWIVGLVVMVVLMVAHFNFLLLLIFGFSLPRLFSLFRKRTTEEQRFYEVTPGQRVVMSVMYFGLIGFLVLGMAFTQIAVKS